MPMTGNIIVDKEKIGELVDQLRLEIPQEVRSAQEVLEQRDQILNNATLDARRAKSQAEDEFREKLNQNEVRKRAEEMMKEAEQKAARLVQQAEAESQARRTEADAYALRSLRELERELATLSGSVRKGIDVLAGNALVGAGSNGNGHNPESE